jgi:hypothetical protein
LGVSEVVVLVSSGNESVWHFRHRPLWTQKISRVVSNDNDPFKSLRAGLRTANGNILILEGHALNDRRILEKLVNADSVAAIISPTGLRKAGAAVLSSSEATLLERTTAGTVTGFVRKGIQKGEVPALDLTGFDPYLYHLRRVVPPYLLLVEDARQLVEADDVLRRTVHKGVNDFVAKYIHPPLEFGALRFLVDTPVTPNQVTTLSLIISALVIPLFAYGHLLTGLVLAAVKGVLDGIDGKLARLVMLCSKTGDRLDHIGDVIFDALWYLALGWHFSSGDLSSTEAFFTKLLICSYIVERIVPGIFKKMHTYEIYDYGEVDKIARLIGSRINNNVWLMMIGILIGKAQEAFYIISLWMLTTASWHTFRLIYITLKTRMWRSSA